MKEFLKQERIEVHSGYKLFGVSGCKWCPVHRRSIYKKILQKFPDLYDDFIELEREVNRPCVEGGRYWLRDIKTEVLEEAAGKRKKEKEERQTRLL